MSLANEPWKIDNEAKVAKIARAMSQDVGRNFRDNTIRKIFPKKIIKDEESGRDVDIGLICCDWLYKLLTEFELTNEQLDRVIYLLIKSYESGYNFENNNSFRKYIAFYIAPTFRKKLNKFSQIAKLSFMDNLDKPNKSKKINEGDDIQW